MPMALTPLFSLVERLRQETIGEPTWITSKSVFEYPGGNVEAVAVLKAIRAAQGVKSLELLCTNGLFIDLGALYRCVRDANAEIYFLLENYPKQSTHVQRFVKGFFESTIDSHLDRETNHVPMKTIHNAMVRVLTNCEQDEETRTRILDIYETFSGYIHANYSHVMEIYGGQRPTLSFNVGGVPSHSERLKRMELVDQARLSVIHSIAYIALVLGKHDIHRDAMRCR